jgi:serine/threonine protein kinase
LQSDSDAAYEIPSSVSPYARDLISRMLQVDPRRRISIPDIKSHPWMRTSVPIYMKLTNPLIIYKDDEPEIDNQILTQVKELNLNFNGYTEEKISKVILKRDDISFAVAYELLKSEKDRKLSSETQVAPEEEHSIFKNLRNTALSEYPPPMNPMQDKFDYGKSY